MAQVSVIIVNYNGRHFLGECFGSLARQIRPADEVILVDNASTDGSVDYTREHFPWVKVVASETNTGFAEGNNLGLAQAQGDYLALLNNDTEVDEGWLEELVRTLDADGQVGAAVSKIYLASSYPTLDCAGAEFNNLGFCWGRGSNQLDRGQFDTASEVPAVTACAMLLRREALGGAPLFDERLFMYYEEFDLSLRLRGRRYAIVYVPTAVVYHKRSEGVKGATRKPVLFQQFYGNRNRVKILFKYYPPAVLLRSLPLIFLSLAYWDGVFLRDGGWAFFARAVVGQVRYAWQGLRERLRGDAGVEAKHWLPWMTNQGLREVLALKSALGAYVK